MTNGEKENNNLKSFKSRPFMIPPNLQHSRGAQMLNSIPALNPIKKHSYRPSTASTLLTSERNTNIPKLNGGNSVC